MVGRSMRYLGAVALLLALVLSLALLPQGASSFMVEAGAVKPGEIPSDAVADPDSEIDATAELQELENVNEGEDEPTPGAGKVEILGDNNFEKITQASTGATTGDWFVKFYASWCSHCKKLESTWDELAQKLEGKVNVAKVDITANKKLKERFGIKSFPTLLMISHGKVYKFTGGRKLDTLLDYAEGGFKGTSGQPVPTPHSLTNETMDMLNTVVKDLEGITQGEMPGTMTLILLLTALVLVISIVAVVAVPSGASSTRVKQD